MRLFAGLEVKDFYLFATCAECSNFTGKAASLLLRYSAPKRFALISRDQEAQSQNDQGQILRRQTAVSAEGIDQKQQKDQKHSAV